MVSTARKESDARDAVRSNKRTNARIVTGEPAWRIKGGRTVQSLVQNLYMWHTILTIGSIIYCKNYRNYIYI